MYVIERYTSDNNWVILTVIFLMVMISVLKFYNPKRLRAYVACFFLKGFFQKRVEDNESLFSLFNIIFIFYSILMLGLIISSLVFEQLLFMDYLEICLSLLIYYIIRLSLDYFLQKIVEKNYATQHYRYAKLGYLFTVSVWLLPVFILYYFQWKNHIFLLSLTAILLALRAIFVMLTNKKLIFENLFYFILYLCTLEIAPVLILYKLA